MSKKNSGVVAKTSLENDFEINFSSSDLYRSSAKAMVQRILDENKGNKGETNSLKLSELSLKCAVEEGGEAVVTKLIFNSFYTGGSLPEKDVKPFQGRAPKKVEEKKADSTIPGSLYLLGFEGSKKDLFVFSDHVEAVEKELGKDTIKKLNFGSSYAGLGFPESFTCSGAASKVGFEAINKYDIVEFLQTLNSWSEGKKEAGLKNHITKLVIISMEAIRSEVIFGKVVDLLGSHESKMCLDGAVREIVNNWSQEGQKLIDPAPSKVVISSNETSKLTEQKLAKARG